jgi:hypothetical protein
MSASRKGLKRAGLRRYVVAGARKEMLIERECPGKFFVRPVDFPDAPHGFFSQTFRRLRDARAYAEEQAG